MLRLDVTAVGVKTFIRFRKTATEGKRKKKMATKVMFMGKGRITARLELLWDIE